MAFASIATVANNPTLLNPDDVTFVDDNGDGTSTIYTAHRPPLKSTLSASAAVSALGFTAISATRARAARASSFNPTSVVYVQPYGTGCQIRLAGGSTFVASDALATVLALLDATKTVTLTRRGETTAGAVTRDMVASVDSETNPNSGVVGSGLLLKDGSRFQTDTAVASVLTALNA